jgi:nucleoside-diphosphate-sugar epimerase
MTRSPEKTQSLRAAGAEPVVADALDAAAVMTAVDKARPEVIVHQLTALSHMSSFRNPDRLFQVTNRLRREGTDNLIAAARNVGVRRLVAQSYAGWPYARDGGPVKTEDDPLDPHPPPSFRLTLDAIRHLETAVVGVEGVVLRYGSLYGPGTSLGQSGVHLAQVRKRRFPIVGAGTGVWSFIHVHDAAEATVVAIERAAPGIYNIVDDEPAPVADWLPVLAAAIGARPPLRLPVWIGRLAGGEATVSVMTQVRGASNAKAKRELGWRPRYASWRQGFQTGLG